MVSCGWPSQHCQSRINCCCKRFDGIKGELRVKSCLFFLPHITAIMATDERAGGIHHLNGVLASYPKALA
ncbi:hypothetical protein CPI84_15235 [Erwinia pyrifoliae]|nr:hypothetical protein CPI84_15235 [Erwinia pyrifoliae]MCA8875987.1 hypothetical protein [Erwinia pyrifoliae]